MLLTLQIRLCGVEQAIFDRACELDPALTLSEFVTAMMRKGIHYGIETEARDTIARVEKMRASERNLKL